MTAELATYNPAGSLIAQGQERAVARLSDWADEARAAASIATSLCKTSFVPEVFRGRPEEATAAILTGHELGLSPMASLRAIYVIKGTPAMYANTLRAVVQSQGHDIWVEESTDTRAIVAARRRGTSEVERSTWTMDRAKKAGLAGNQQYQKNPQAMLVARATAEVCRRIAADALHGIPHAVEELDDGPGDVTPEPTQTVKPATKRTARRAPVEPKAPAPVEEPAFDDTPDWAPQPEPQQPRKSAYSVAGNRPAGDDQPASDKQVANIGRLCGELGLTDRDEAVRVVSSLAGRDVTSRKQLTRAEASSVIDQMQADVDARQEAQQPDEPTLDEQ